MSKKSSDEFDLEEAFVLIQSPPDYHEGLTLLFPRPDPEDDDQQPPLVDRVALFPTQQIGVRCDPALVLMLDAIASSYRLTRADLIRRALHHFVRAFPGDYEVVYAEFRGEGVEPLRKPNAVGTGSAATPAKPKIQGGR